MLFILNLPPTLQTGVSSNTVGKGTLVGILERVEKQLITDTLIAVHGSIVKAANQLGITERVMGLRIQKYHIPVQNYKNLTDEAN